MSEFNDVTAGKNFCELTPEQGLDYACEDAEVALDLWLGYSEGMEAYPFMESTYWDLEMPFIRVLRHIMDTGMELDKEFLLMYSGELSSRMEPLQKEWDFLSGGINFRSPLQMQHWYKEGLWDTKGVKYNKKTDLYSCKADYVKVHAKKCKKGSLGRAAAETLLGMRRLSKLTSTYTTNFVAIANQYPDGRLHTDLRHEGAATGRLSSSNPNLANIPVRTEEGAEILRAFRAPPNFKLLSSDYSQIELRVLAHLAGPGKLLDAYLEGADVHQRTADMLGLSRDDAKTLIFAVIYGATGVETGTRGLG